MSDKSLQWTKFIPQKIISQKKNYPTALLNNAWSKLQATLQLSKELSFLVAEFYEWDGFLGLCNSIQSLLKRTKISDVTSIILWNWYIQQYMEELRASTPMSGWPWTYNSPVSASQVAVIKVLYYQTQLKFKFHSKLYASSLQLIFNILIINIYRNSMKAFLYSVCQSWCILFACAWDKFLPCSPGWSWIFKTIPPNLGITDYRRYRQRCATMPVFYVSRLKYTYYSIEFYLI